MSYVCLFVLLKVTITVDGDMVATIKEVSSSNPSCQHSVFMYSLLPLSPKYRLHFFTGCDYFHFRILGVW